MMVESGNHTARRRRKLRSYVLISYNIKRMSFKTFTRKGNKIKMTPTVSLNLPSVTGSILAVERAGKVSTEVIVAGEKEFFHFDLAKNKTIDGVTQHKLWNICNIKCWNKWTMYFLSDRNVIFTLNNFYKAFKSSEFFGDSYCGGYHTYSRNAEVVDDYMLFITNNNTLIKYDLKNQLKAELLKQSKIDFSEDDICQTITNDRIKFESISGEVVYRGIIETFFVRDHIIFIGTSNGEILQVEQPLNTSKLHNRKCTTLASFYSGMISAMNYFFGNIVVSSFQSGRAELHSFNLKHKLTSSVKIDSQRWPAHKIEMFIKNKICFGLSLNRGLSMHVFGIHECRLYMFSESVEVASSHIAGILFLDDTRVLVYGARGYNMLFRISM